MERINILKLSIYQIQMFLSVANSESITISSRNLHLSPSMLSKNIAKLEEDLGLILFRREKGRLYLTPAGKVLQCELGIAVEIIQQGIQKAKAEQECKVQPIRIGYPEPCNKKLLQLSLQDFKQKAPEFDYNVEFYPFQKLPLEIQHGNLDIIFTSLFEEPSVRESGMDYQVLIRYPLTISVVQENPLSKKERVAVEELKGMRLIMESPVGVPNYYDGVIRRLLIDRSIIPKISYVTNTSDAVAANVKAADEFMISDPNHRVEDFYKLVQIPIDDSESGMVLAWNSDSHVLLNDFARNTIEFWKKNAGLIY